MKNHVPYEDAIDLLDADHKAVKKLFLNYVALCGKSGTEETRHTLAQSICQSLTVHSRLEEEIFYPQVCDATGNAELMEKALAGHAHADALMREMAVPLFARQLELKAQPDSKKEDA